MRVRSVDVCIYEDMTDPDFTIIEFAISVTEIYGYRSIWRILWHAIGTCRIEEAICEAYRRRNGLECQDADTATLMLCVEFEW
jgi:hypothetical protein